jgi:hypothetical protein
MEMLADHLARTAQAQVAQALPEPHQVQTAAALVAMAVKVVLLEQTTTGQVAVAVVGIQEMHRHHMQATAD